MKLKNRFDKRRFIREIIILVLGIAVLYIASGIGTIFCAIGLILYFRATTPYEERIAMSDSPEIGFWILILSILGGLIIGLMVAYFAGVKLGRKFLPEFYGKNKSTS